jgi:hypothetical protein
MFTFSHRDSRPVTSELIDMAEQGMLDWEQLARDALGCMSESDVADFARSNDLIQAEDEEDGQPDEAQEWESFDADC